MSLFTGPPPLVLLAPLGQASLFSFWCTFGFMMSACFFPPPQTSMRFIPPTKIFQSGFYRSVRPPFSSLPRPFFFWCPGVFLTLPSRCLGRSILYLLPLAALSWKTNQIELFPPSFFVFSSCLLFPRICETQGPVSVRNFHSDGPYSRKRVFFSRP